MHADRINLLLITDKSGRTSNETFTSGLVLGLVQTVRQSGFFAHIGAMLGFAEIFRPGDMERLAAGRMPRNATHATSGLGFGFGLVAGQVALRGRFF